MLLVGALILILFLPITFLPLALNTYFPASELEDMGIRLESATDEVNIFQKLLPSKR